MISNKREFLARQFNRVGLTRALERSSRRPALLVANYHRIGRPEASPFFDGVFSATPESFAAEVASLRDRFRLITLAELLDQAESGFPFREPTALITFDDGYRDNLDAALPVLRSLGASATFFLVTGFLDAGRLPWWDHVAYVVKRTEAPRLVLDRPAPLAIDLGGISRAEAVMTVIRAWHAHPPRVEDEPEVRRHLEDRAGVSVDEPALARGLFLSWDDARCLTEAGMAIGSHTRAHPTLARLSEAEQFRELAESKRLLEQHFHREVAALAYPFGGPGDTTAATRRLAREAGYRLAFSTITGENRAKGIDPFQLRRLNIGITDTPGLLRARLALSTSFGRSFL